LQLNQLVIQKSWFNLGEVKQDIIDVIGLQAEMKGIRLDFDFSP
jgi:hypothetical protein